MASTIVLTIKSARSSSDALNRLAKAGPKESAKALEAYFKALAGGLESASVDVQGSALAPVAAQSTATLVSVPADDTITIGKTVLTAKASPANENQFSQAGTDAQDATSLAAVINAHSVLSKLVQATAVGNVVTIRALVKGSIGNYVVLARTGTAITVTGSGYLTGGAGGSESKATTYSLGL